MAYPISDVLRRVVYTGSAGVGPYSFSFEILANTDILVYKNTTLLTLTTNYTVTINANGTGSVTLVVAATGADTITIAGDRAIQRATDFVTGGDLFANTLNDEFDSLVIFSQQIDEKADRALKAPVTDPTTINMTLPAKADRASKYLAFDSNGNPIVSSGTGTTVVSSVMEPVVSAASLSDARTNLGLGTIEFGFKNRIINGAMVIDQRNAGASISVTAGNDGYPVDRFYIGNRTGSGVFSGQQTTASNPVGYKSVLGVTTTTAQVSLTATQWSAVRHSIEGFNVSDLGWGTANAATVTLSFWGRSSLTGTFGGSLRNSAQDRSYPFSYTISAANEWEQKSVTIAGDTSGTWLTDSGVGVNLTFSLGTGATLSGTAGSWAGANYISATGATSVVGTNGATFYITGVQLEKSSTATSFDYRPYGTELALCQRYYQNLNSQTIDCHGATLSTSTYTPISSIPFKVTMRATPTMGSSAFTILAGPSTATLSISANSADSMSMYVNKGANAWSSGSNTFTFNSTATIEL